MTVFAIAEFLASRLPEAGAAWLRSALAEVGAQPEQLDSRWSGAGRRLGKGAVVVTAGDAERLRAAGATFVPGGWGADECGRALLLLQALDKSPATSHETIVEALYRTGDIRERQALLRALCYLPNPERFVTLAIESVRANVLSELEAIACENPYPARYFPASAFNQLVLKCLFNGISLRRIEGFEGRRSDELVRMVTAYAGERRAAGRLVPEDVAFVLDGGS